MHLGFYSSSYPGGHCWTQHYGRCVSRNFTISNERVTVNYLSGESFSRFIFIDNNSHAVSRSTVEGTRCISYRYWQLGRVV